MQSSQRGSYLVPVLAVALCVVSLFSIVQMVQINQLVARIAKPVPVSSSQQGQMQKIKNADERIAFYTDTKYGFQFMTSSACRQLSVKQESDLDRYGAVVAAFGVYISDTDWPENSPFNFYAMMERKAYDKWLADEEEMHNAEIALDYGSKVLLRYFPQDGPSRIPDECMYSVEKTVVK